MKKLAALVVVAAAVLAALVWQGSRDEPFEVSGFLEADEIRVGSRIGGRVAEVLVEEGEAVAAGAVLVELEPFDRAERRAEAEAELAARRADLRLLENGPRPQEIQAGRARVDLSKAEVELAQLEFDRASSLARTDVVSAEVRDRAERQLKVARAELDVREQELALLVEGFRPEEIDRARASVQAAEAALAAVERQIAELTVRAPADGVVESIDLRPGDLVGPDAPVLSILDPTLLWVRAYVPENRLTLRLGDEVAVSVDSYPSESFRGRVGFMARQAEFTPRNVQTPEERSKQVFRIKVFLEEGLDRLRPGMAADVRLTDGD